MRRAIKIIQKLNLTEQESLELLSGIHPELKNALNRKMEVQELANDEFGLISNWIHFDETRNNTTEISIPEQPSIDTTNPGEW